MPKLIFTIGHSTRPLEETARILRHWKIRQLVDVRTIPRSLRNPQFNRETLARFLRNRRINYRHMKDLGGLRHARAGSTENLGWRNASFRGYADYMQTDSFKAALKKIITLSRKRRTAIMCAEAVPWRCHRSLIADALELYGVKARHIFSASSAKVHVRNPMAKVSGKKIIYPQ